MGFLCGKLLVADKGQQGFSADGCQLFHVKHLAD
jgi:hypothetical protein